MKAKIKYVLYLLSFSVFVGWMASCLGGTEYDDYDLTDAELLSVIFYHNDSLPELENVIFTIEQRGEVGLIYNYDSMAYLTELPEKVFIEYISGSGMNNVLNITGDDSVWVKSGDEIIMYTPQILKVFAIDGKTTKRYIAQINIHQVNPDSVQYHLLASDLSFLQTEDTKTIVFNDCFLTYSKINNEIQLHSSQDAMNWIKEPISGLPANAVIRGIQSNGNQLFAYTEEGELYVRYDETIDQWVLINKPASIKIRSILGYLNDGPKQSQGLSLVIETQGKCVFAFTKDFLQWDYDSVALTPIPVDFPVYDFSTHSYQVMLTERISIFGGMSLSGEVLNTVWSTENGLYWAKLSGSTNTFRPLRGANIFYYNQEFWLINGISSTGNYVEYVYYSRDGGITWFVKGEDMFHRPEEYLQRYNASLVTDKDNKYFYIIGGKNEDLLPEVWKGYLNKMEFEH